MYNSEADYGFGALCPWPRDSYEYGGLCSHNSLLESIPGAASQLSPKELLDAAEQRRIRNNAFKLDYLKFRAPASCLESRQKSRNEYNRRVRQWQRDNPTPEAIEQRRSREQARLDSVRAREDLAIGNKEFHCKVCDESFRNATLLRNHKETPSHQAAWHAATHCEPCNRTFDYPSLYADHLLHKGHQDNLKRLAGQSLKRKSTDAQLQRDGEKRARKMASNEFRCDICGFSFENAGLLDIHNNTKRHKQKVAGTHGSYKCEPCNVEFKFESDYKTHCKRQYHLKAVAEAAPTS